MKVAKKFTPLLAAASAGALCASGAMAGEMDYSHYSTVEAGDETLTHAEGAVSATRLLDGSVVSAGGLEGDILDIALAEDGEASFLIFETSEAVPGGAPQGSTGMSFATFDNISIQEMGGALEVEAQLAMDNDGETPMDLEITEDEADSRLVSRMMDSEVRFSDGETRPIQDVLLTADGHVELAVIDADGNMDTPETTAIPFDKLAYDTSGWYQAEQSMTPSVLWIIG